MPLHRFFSLFSTFVHHLESHVSGGLRLNIFCCDRAASSANGMLPLPRIEPCQVAVVESLQEGRCGDIVITVGDSIELRK